MKLEELLKNIDEISENVYSSLSRGTIGAVWMKPEYFNHIEIGKFKIAYNQYSIIFDNVTYSKNLLENDNIELYNIIYENYPELLL